MTALDMFFYEHGKNELCPMTKLPDPFIAVQLPNYTPVDERKGYCDLGAFRLVIEDGNAVGVYCPGGLKADPATTTGGFRVKLPVMDEMSAYPVNFTDWQAARFTRDAIEPSYLDGLEGTVLEGCHNSEELNRRLDDIQRADFEKFIRENAAELAGKVSPFFLRLANALRPIADAAEAGKTE